MKQVEGGGSCGAPDREVWVLQEMMDLAHKIEERNLVVEKIREDFLSKHLKNAMATKWTVTKPNESWTGAQAGQNRLR